MRYLPHTDEERQLMLQRIGVAGIDDLFACIPASRRLKAGLDLPRHKGEQEVERILSSYSAQNMPAGSGPFFIGAGAYKHHVPASVDHLIQRSEFLTSYTPYQPEISQGTLQILFEFQTQVANLTGMEIANASMYDGSTGCMEAVLMAHRITRRHKAIVSGGLHPQCADVVQDMSAMANVQIERLAPDVTANEDITASIDAQTSCVVVQYPDFYGNLRDLSVIADKCHENGALLIAVFTEAVSLGLIEPPGAMGADIVVGEGQSIGNGLNFGGPYLGLFATRQKYLRQMPGRIAGQTLDADHERGYVLTLSTREQHIRREKATSNICTNSGLCALAFSIHMSLLGEKGLRQLARVNHANAVKLADMLAGIDRVEVLNSTFFNEFTIRVPGDAAGVIEKLAGKGVLGGVPVSRLLPGAGLDDLIVVAATEVNTDQDRQALLDGLKEAL